MRKPGLRSAAALSLGLVLALVAAACSSKNGSGSGSGTALTGAGSTFAQPVYAAWAQEFQKVESVYPTSPYVAQGKKKVVECYDRLAEHERLVGRFYQKRKKYNAAIDRYRAVLDHYPQYTRTGQVLFDIGKCLLKVGNRPEAEEFFTRLFQDQPGSPLASKAKDLLAQFDRDQHKENRKEPKG